MITVDPPQLRSATMTTRFGPVRLHAFAWPDEPPYAVLQSPDAAPTGQPSRLRLQGQCLTSTAFAADMCDCGAQIEAGVRLAAGTPGAVMVYLPQEGRGHGLLSKVEVMAQVNRGLTLAEAQRATGRPEVALRYHRVPAILAALEVTGVVLVTGSPLKADAVRAAGVPLVAIEPI